MLRSVMLSFCFSQSLVSFHATLKRCCRSQYAWQTKECRWLINLFIVYT